MWPFLPVLLLVLSTAAHAEAPASSDASVPTSEPASGGAPIPGETSSPTSEPSPSEGSTGATGGDAPLRRVDLADVPESTPIEWVEIRVKRRPKVYKSDYPEEARARGLPGERCAVRIYIDEAGIPYDAKPEACSEVFFPSARAIAMRYTFHPVRIDRKPAKVEFILQVNFGAPK